MQFPISTGFYENQWPATLDWHLVFYKIICRMRFTSAVWCWQHRDCVYKAAGSVLSHVHQFHTAVAPIATLSWLSSIHQKAVQFSHGLDAYLKAKIALCSACNIAFKTPVLFFWHLCTEFVHPGPGCSPWGRSGSTQKCFVRDVDDVLIQSLWLPIPSALPTGRGIVITALSQGAIAALLEWLAPANSIEKEHL